MSARSANDWRRSALDDWKLSARAGTKAAVLPIRNRRYAVLPTSLAREVETQSREGSC